LLPETEEHGARDVAERLRADIASINREDDAQLTMSAGIAIYPTHAQDAAELIRQADAALYQAKRAGKNRVMVANEE
jgi:diguanylate cyclase (GGDEF)-like protein